MQHQVVSCLSYHLHHRVRTAIAVQGLLLLPRGEGWDGAKNEDGVDVLFRTFAHKKSRQRALHCRL